MEPTTSTAPSVSPEAKVTETPEVKLPATEVPPEQTPVAKKKIKWGNTEKEVSFEEAVQLAQKAWGIEEKAKHAASQAQQAQSLLDMIKTNPREFAKRARAAGLDPQKLATEILYEQFELNSLTPEQKELRELKAKEADAEALRKQTEEAAKNAEIDKKTRDWAQKFEKELQDALAAKKLPMSRLTLALAAQYVDAGLAQKQEWTVNDVLPYVLRDLKNIHLSTMGSLEGEALLEYIGDDMSNKVAAARVARYKKSTSQQSNPVQKTQLVTVPGRVDISKLKGKAYWAALRKQKSEQGVGAFPGQE